MVIIDIVPDCGYPVGMKEKLQKIKKETVLRYAGVALVIVLLAVVWLIRTGGDGFAFSVNGGEGEGNASPDRYGVPVSDAPAAGDASEAPPDAEKPTIVCEIDGEVMNPGVYTVPEGTRIYELIELAGGLTERAYTIGLNRAERLSDGVKVVVPSVETKDSVTPVIRSGSGGSAKININTASAADLQTLDGIGPAMADRILKYRKKAGGFASVEEIMNVSGIGSKTFEKIKNDIRVD